MLSVHKLFLFIHISRTVENRIYNILLYYLKNKIATHEKHQDGVVYFEVSNNVYEFIKHSTLKYYQEIL